MHQIIDFILSTVSGWGYLGIFVLMAIESSAIPFPSEIVIVPAGYLVHKGEMDFFLVLISGITGSILGALINYYFALILGRRFIHKYGHHFFMPPEKLEAAETFFQKHGAFSTFSGRLIPVIRQLISIPAGLAKMGLPKFIFYTAFGAGIWVTILTLLGYFIGQNEDLIKEYLRTITIILIIALIFGTYAYLRITKARNAKSLASKED